MTWAMELPLGVTDPMFTCELALQMGMPVEELGRRMSNYELNVIWPAYFAARATEQQLEAEKQGGR